MTQSALFTAALLLLALACRAAEADGGDVGDDAPVDCVGSWSPWVGPPVTCGNLTEQRHFRVTTPEARGGQRCSVADGKSDLRRLVAMPCPVDCVGSWSEWTDCSVTCGRGSKTRMYTVLVEQAHGGRTCGRVRPDGSSLLQSGSSQARVDVPRGAGRTCFGQPVTHAICRSHTLMAFSLGSLFFVVSFSSSVHRLATAEGRHAPATSTRRRHKAATLIARGCGPVGLRARSPAVDRARGGQLSACALPRRAKAAPARRFARDTSLALPPSRAPTVLLVLLAKTATLWRPRRRGRVPWGQTRPK
jgi:hypothetical protein